MVLKKAVLYKVWDSWNANMKKIRKMRNTGAKVVLLWQRLGLSTGFYGWIERKPEANGRCGRKDCFEVEAHHTHQLSHVVVDGAPVRQKPEEEECRTGSASDAEDEAGVGVCQAQGSDCVTSRVRYLHQRLCDSVGRASEIRVLVRIPTIDFVLGFCRLQFSANLLKLARSVAVSRTFSNSARLGKI